MMGTVEKDRYSIIRRNWVPISDLKVRGPLATFFVDLEPKVENLSIRR